MHIQKFYIGEILKELSKRMKDVSANVYPEHRPSGIGEQKKDMIVISMPTRINDSNAWQKSSLSIQLIVRDKSNGYADIPRLDEMLNSVISKFPITTSRFSATSPRLMIKGADGLGFTIWDIRAKLIINTTDSYQ